MFEVGKTYDFEGDAERLGVVTPIAGTFVCVETGDGYAILRDARYDVEDSPFAAHDVRVHTYKVAT